MLDLDEKEWNKLRDIFASIRKAIEQKKLEGISVVAQFADENDVETLIAESKGNSPFCALAINVLQFQLFERFNNKLRELHLEQIIAEFEKEEATKQ